MTRRILNRKEMRADFDAAEQRERQEDEAPEPHEEDAADEAEEEAADEDETGDEADEVEAPAKKKKVVKAKAKPRSRVAKVARLKVVWGVFNNSNQRVATFEYPKRQDAEAHAAKLTADKRAAHFIQPIKEPMEEK